MRFRRQQPTTMAGETVGEPDPFAGVTGGVWGLFLGLLALYTVYGVFHMAGMHQYGRNHQIFHVCSVIGSWAFLFWYSLRFSEQQVRWNRWSNILGAWPMRVYEYGLLCITPSFPFVCLHSVWRRKRRGQRQRTRLASFNVSRVYGCEVRWL